MAMGPMDERRLRSLRLPELAALWLDCKSRTGTSGFKRDSGPTGTSREALVADLLAWQTVACDAGARDNLRDCKHDQNRAPVLTIARPLRGGLRRKSRNDRSLCATCGWSAKASVCACPFLRMDPFRHVTKVLSHSAITPISHWHTSYGSCSVRLTRVDELHDDLNGERVELRMVRRRAVDQHAWPAKLTIKVDEKEVGTIESPNLDDFGHEVRCRPVPLDLSEHIPPGSKCMLRLDASEGAVGDVGQYVFCVVRTGSSGVDELLQECVGSSQSCSEAESWQLLRSLSQVGDSLGDAEPVECVAPWQQPLLCPLTLTRMKIPVRGRQCQHLRCFDLEAYLSTSASTLYQRRWHCPLCDRRVLPADIVICGLTERLLEQADPALTQVPLNPDSSAARAKPGGLVLSSLPPATCRQGVTAQSEGAVQDVIVTGPWRKRLKRPDGMVHALELQ
mmetsp:Transcript_18198/g.42346  ORF Transcript_18198/g.42346 Transcript_18198/m.42346 type:complete len:450 (+) Transcript_18198:38-1387(+)